jgi:DNA repair exonuclease SbcCD ATPase subunit
MKTFGLLLLIVIIGAAAFYLGDGSRRNHIALVWNSRAKLNELSEAAETANHTADSAADEVERIVHLAADLAKLEQELRRPNCPLEQRQKYVQLSDQYARSPGDLKVVVDQLVQNIRRIVAITRPDLIQADIPHDSPHLEVRLKELDEIENVNAILTQNLAGLKAENTKKDSAISDLQRQVTQIKAESAKDASGWKADLDRARTEIQDLRNATALVSSRPATSADTSDAKRTSGTLPQTVSPVVPSPAPAAFVPVAVPVAPQPKITYISPRPTYVQPPTPPRVYIQVQPRR